MTKIIFAAAMVAFISAPAVAQESSATSVTVGTERALESEVNSLFASTNLGPASLGVTMEDTAIDSGNFNVTKYEADFDHAINGVTLYMNNDFDDGFKHSETVIGAKITF